MTVAIPRTKPTFPHTCDTVGAVLVRLLGALLFLAGAAGTAYATWATFEKRRPLDIAFGALAPVALIIALVGLLLVFVPGFF